MTRQSELITVIIPVYNVEAYIDECMETVVNQTYSNLEILLINDGSSDGSLNKCVEWAKKDARIRVIDEENRGVAQSRNRGTEADHPIDIKLRDNHRCRTVRNQTDERRKHRLKNRICKQNS